MMTKQGGFYFFTLLISAFFLLTVLSCADFLAPPQSGQEIGPNTLALRISDGSGARTAYPGAALTTYKVTVYKANMTDLLSASQITVSESGLHRIPLNGIPEVNDVVSVEGFNSGNVKTAEGSTKLAAAHISGTFTSVTVTVTPLMTGTGSVDLSVNFPAFNAAPDPDTEITAAEITLYASFADYKDGAVFQFSRYVKESSYGTGTAFGGGGTSIPLNYASLPSGNYVAKIEFFRGKFVKIKTLVQTILVRDGLTTNTWDGGSSTLPLMAADFASSNANLEDIKIGGTTISGFDSAAYNYSILKGWAGAETPALTVTSGAPGQKIEAVLNGTAVPNGSGLTLKKDSNSLAITVTAPDGVTKQTYAVSYTYRHGTVWYVSATSGVSPAGNDTTGDGTAAAPYATVEKALDAIEDVYAVSWEGKGDVPRLPVPALIQISGTIGMSSTIYIQDDSSTIYTNLPPIILTGDGGGAGEISKTGGGEALAILDAHVILGDNLTIAGGHVRVDAGSVFIMNGGTISGNTATSGGGVLAGGTFTMNGGTISGNTATSGGGVFINGAFTMNGGAISGNTASGSNGGGVFVNTNAAFTMNGGTVSGNTAASTAGIGGGVYIYEGAFTMNGGSVSGNEAVGGNGGGGVHVDGNSATFTMNGGTISENKTRSGSYGGGVYIYDGTFTMDGGTISGNTASGGGGVYVDGNSATFTMNGGTISGHTLNGRGGGVNVASGTFTMNDGTISGNSVTGNSSGGGGVNVATGTFTMNGGTISGNTANYNNGSPGGGVNVVSGSVTFNMNGGSVSGNSATSGGGVNVAGIFDMSGGSVSGNSATGESGSGGGVCVSGGLATFYMSGGALVNTGNTVYLGSGRVITLNGVLTANPAANIQPSNTAAGTQLLNTVYLGAGTPPNYQRFLVNGVAGKIGPDGTYTGP